MAQVGFKKPIVLTGSQLPLAMPRSDARANIIDSVTCLTSFFTRPHVQLQVRSLEAPSSPVLGATAQGSCIGVFAAAAALLARCAGDVPVPVACVTMLCGTGRVVWATVPGSYLLSGPCG